MNPFARVIPIVAVVTVAALSATLASAVVERRAVAANAAETPQLSIQPLPAEMINKQRALTGHLQPSTRAWIGQEAYHLTKSKIVDEEGLRPAIRARFTPNQSALALNNSAIDVIAFTVLMQA